MRQLAVGILFTLLVQNVFAQIPEDAIKYSWLPQNGTARSLAIGGAMGSTGGDLMANYVNPAGIAFYKTGEATFSGGLLLNNLKSNYRNESFKANKTNFILPTLGFAVGLPSLRDERNSHAFSLAFTQTANFNKTLKYSGYNNFSSFAEQFAEEFVNSGLSIDNALNSQSGVPFGAAPALYTYLIDTVRIGSNLIVQSAPENILLTGAALRQNFERKSSGGLYEIAGTYAGSIDNKLMWGVTLGMPIFNYRSTTTASEEDSSSNNNNGFNKFNYIDEYSTKGFGLNGKFGIIYRPKEFIRLGLAMHTPTFSGLTDVRETRLNTELNGATDTFSVSSNLFTNNAKGRAEYMQNTPWRFIVSGAYVFREVADVTKQKGFITADIEYVTHGSTRFSSDAETETNEEKEYFKALNKVVKDSYKGSFNFRVGGELKFNTLMARAGFAYYSNPVQDAASKTNMMQLSTGLGYRHKGYFIDLTYVHRITKGFDVPYRLQNAVTEFAALKQTTGNVVATFGVKF
jgi:hypothetical protein